VGYYREYRLHFNENLLLPREYYEEIMSVVLDPQLLRYYTEPLNEGFNKLLSTKLGIKEGYVFAVAGADEGLRLLIQFATLGNGRVLVVEPTYSIPELAAKSMGLEVIHVRLSDDYGLDLDSILSREVDVMYICNPNNPTGNLFPRDQVEELVSRTDSLVIIDEAYAEFAGSSLVDLTYSYDNVAIVRTFSKAWGLAGLRVGYVVGSRDIIEGLRRISLPHNIPYVSMAMVARALDLKHYVDESISEIARVRDYMFSRLAGMGLRPLRSVTNFITFHAYDADGLYEELRRRGFVLRNLSGKVMCEDCLRATVPPMDVARELLDNIEEILRAR